MLIKNVVEEQDVNSIVKETIQFFKRNSDISDSFKKIDECYKILRFYNDDNPNCNREEILRIIEDFIKIITNEELVNKLIDLYSFMLNEYE